MTRVRAMVPALLLIVPALASPVAAQQLPSWPLTEICAKEPQQCLAFEARAREAVSGGWGVLPEAYRTACLAEIGSPADRSWRLLSQCLEQQVLKGLDRKAITTSATPSEPVPVKAATEGAAGTGVPPPPFAIPPPPTADKVN